MKITIEVYEQKYMIETRSDDMNIDEIVEELKKILYLMGYHPDNIKEVFYEGG